MRKVIVIEARHVTVSRDLQEVRTLATPFLAQLQKEGEGSRHTRIIAGSENNLNNLAEALLWMDIPIHAKTMSLDLGSILRPTHEAETIRYLEAMLQTADINILLPYLSPLRLARLICAVHHISFSEEEKGDPYPFGTLWVINLERGKKEVRRIDP